MAGKGRYPHFRQIIVFVMNTSFCFKYPEIYNFINSIPKPDCKFLYGTAGFRMNYELLPSVFIRVGIIGTLRSKYLKKVGFLFLLYFRLLDLW